MDGFANDPFEGMPLDLMMLVEVRCEALKKYRAMSEDGRKRADELASCTRGRVEKERIIDTIERGGFE